ncbi:uncharacterized protein MELLADRAFT_87253 [Melampsora larici-populina 98AG31]|uniref:Uncharacterized protein n=1 Tax=Melampsora larici-populina (strain 98AG31 / pathotype 3-4-7) TaxID=747676 RepID=F4SDR5_MELLP|nr:uncharacterized protein MELLADRAFT_87253 [Melampsora larici-populina 98AG31]EGF97209.1 hypothetical protein MELLADRAFT_87253 [Melampsora larici-populina 98AG31]
MSSPKVTALMKEVLLLSQNCPSIRKATTDDRLYNMFSNPPVDPSIDEDTITITINTNLDNVYGVDCGSTYLLSGIHGIQRVLDYIDTARKHPNWTSNVDSLVLLKLEGMKDKLKAAGAALPAANRALGPGNTGHKPSKKVANKNASNVATVLDYHAAGKKHPFLDDDKDAGPTVKKNKIAEKDTTNSSSPGISRMPRLKLRLPLTLT